MQHFQRCLGSIHYFAAFPVGLCQQQPQIRTIRRFCQGSLQQINRLWNAIRPEKLVGNCACRQLDTFQAHAFNLVYQRSQTFIGLPFVGTLVERTFGIPQRKITLA